MPDGYTIPTANDFLSYQGNAGLAAGAGTGLAPIKTNPLEGVDSSLDKIQQVNAQKAILDYKQKQDQQQQLAQMLAETGSSVFNMKNSNGQNISFNPLPDDQKILAQRAHDLRAQILANPQKYMFDQDYLDKKAEYGQLVNHAGVRASAYNNYNQEAQKTNDQDERAAILAHRDNELKYSLLDGGMPEPYLPKPVFDPQNFISDKDVNDKNMNTYRQLTGTDNDGNQTLTSLNGLNDNVLDFRGKVLPGSKNYADAMNLSHSYLSTIASNPQAVQQHNDNIDRINQERGYVDEKGQPISPHYIPHVAEVVNGKNGPQVVVTATNPQDIAYSVMAEKKGSLTPSQEIKKTEEQEADESVKRRKEKADTAKVLAETSKIKSGKDETIEDKKQDLNKKAVAAVYNDVHTIFSKDDKPISDSDLPKYKVDDKGKRLWTNISGKGDYDYIIPKDKYTVYPAISSNAAKYVGLQAPEQSVTETDPTDESKTTTKTIKGSSADVDTIYPVKDKATGEKKLAFVKDGKVVAYVPEKQAVINGLKDDAKWEPSQYENKLPFVDEVYDGGGKADEGTKSSALASSSPARKVIGGVTYEKGSNGKWYKE